MNIIKTNFKYRYALKPLNLNNVQYIVLHHPEAITATPEQIHEWHYNRYDVVNGVKKFWNGFGYNEYIRKDGTVYIGRGDNVGAQCNNCNTISYGICCEGNYEIEKEMPKAQYNALVQRIKFHLNRFKNAKVVGHGELNPTACPGKYFPLKEVKSAMNETGADAINYLASIGKLSNSDYWKKAIEVVKDLEFVFIKWANDVKE